MQSKDFFIGIDVSKLTLDVSVNGTKNHIRVQNSTEGFKQLQAWLKTAKIAVSDSWFVFEYTGGYEYRLVQFLQAKGLCFTRVPGLQLKKSMGMQRGKSDKTDSLRIAEYGYEKRDKLKEHKAGSTAITRLKLLLTQRSGFVDDKKAHEHRLKELEAMMDLKTGDAVLKHYRAAVDFAVKMITKTEAEIMKLFSKEEALHKNFCLLTSIPGIGKVNAWMTIAYTENFERFPNGRAYGAYIGVVPYEHTSGTSIKGRSRVSPMANKTLKADLSMAAKASVMHDPEMKTYYERRTALGKRHMSIMNEVKFKLILRMFAVVNKKEVYVKNQKSAA
ncbi:MAG TPA: IS110 family transposase [Flavisolibacter sp.]|jgi:transposase|nr:IS110 family transposase [Flavisolibacter sp.]